jgi:serine/threonine protein kinase
MNDNRQQHPEEFPADFGRYRLLKLLGKGGMGRVYLAHDKTLDRSVALKIPHLAGGPTVLTRFYTEARAAAALHHPNICSIHEVGQVEDLPYLTMAFIEGKLLGELARLRPLQPRQSVTLVRKLALALDEAHKLGIIHRDLKPANIMIDRRGEPVIMDFGLARRARPGDARVTQEGSTMGTPAYMPPEQVQGELDVMGPRSDVYSLGVILYELLTGRLPFSGDVMAILAQVLLEEPPPPSRFRPGLDPQLETICLKAMAKKINERHSSMAELAAALLHVLRGTIASQVEGPRTASDSPATGSNRRTPASPRGLQDERTVPPDVARTDQTGTRRSADQLTTRQTLAGPRKRSRPRAEGRKASGIWNMYWLVALGGAAVIVLIAWVVHRTSEMTGPGQSSASASPVDKQQAAKVEPPKPEAPASSGSKGVAFPKPDVVGAADRACVEWVLRRGGNVSLEPNGGGVEAQVYPQYYGGIVVSSEDGATLEQIKRLADAKAELLGPKGFILRHVVLWGRKLRDDDLKNIKGLAGLRTLNLAHTAVSDRGLDQLRELSGLKQLRLNNTAVTADGARRLQSALPGCVIAMEPAISYAKLAAGTWKRVLDKAEDLRSNPAIRFNNGTLEMLPREKIVIPSSRGQDMAIRARVKKLGGGNASLMLRSKGPRSGFTAYFDGGKVFGMGQHRGKWVNFMGMATPNAYTDFFEFTFAAQGDTLAAFVDGMQIMEYRDPRPDSGDAGIGVTNGHSQFKIIEVQKRE